MSFVLALIACSPVSNAAHEKKSQTENLPESTAMTAKISPKNVTQNAACDAFRCSGEEPLPVAITRVLPAGYQVLDYLGGQLNDDALTDYLVIIHKSGESAATPRHRPLLIYTGHSDGSFQLAARNNDIIEPIGQQGTSSKDADPYEDGNLVVKNRYFTVQQRRAEGNQHWTNYRTFHYDAARDDWLFHRETFEVEGNMDDVTSSNTKTFTTRANRRHPISFSAWKSEIFKR